MVFYAYLDPQVIGHAFANRPYGYQCLIAMLRGFMQNCILIDWNGQVWAALGKHTQALPRDSDRMELEKILKFLQGHHRFVDISLPRHVSGIADVLALAPDAELDVIVTTQDKPANAPLAGLEVCSLANFQFTDFEGRRSLSAQGGSTYRHAELDGAIFLDRNFRKALRHARWLRVCDGSLGQNFRGNYRYTTERFLRWFRETNGHHGECPVSFLCLAPTLEGDNRRAPDERKRAELTACFAEFGASVEFYQRLPHERFFLTDQIAVEIGRGMDFLLPDTDRNRDVSIASKNHREVTKLFQSYDRYRVR